MTDILLLQNPSSSRKEDAFTVTHKMGMDLQIARPSFSLCVNYCVRKKEAGFLKWKPRWHKVR